MAITGVKNVNGDIVSNLMPDSIFDKKFGEESNEKKNPVEDNMPGGLELSSEPGAGEQPEDSENKV